LTEPAKPVKEGYTFVGWFDAQTGGTKWNFSTDKMPTNDIDLYAQFSINSYTATFDNDGVTTSQTVDYQGLLQEPTAPTKE
ncbi:InlB B-repeat-containing protein, partial [Escherichia coli]|nr:InlB B-repeat-containing protein [Escherichia coli]